MINPLSFSVFPWQNFGLIVYSERIKNSSKVTIESSIFNINFAWDSLVEQDMYKKIKKYK